MSHEPTHSSRTPQADQNISDLAEALEQSSISNPQSSFEQRCPYDILYMIVRLIDRDSLRALYATSKYTQRVTEPEVFSAYTLETVGGEGGPLHERCKAILARKRASFVKSCKISLDGRSLHHAPPAHSYMSTGTPTRVAPRSSEGDEDSPTIKRLHRAVALGAMANLKRLTLQVSLLDNVDAADLLLSLFSYTTPPDPGSPSGSALPNVHPPPFALEYLWTDAIGPLPAAFVRSQSPSLQTLILPNLLSYHPQPGDFIALRHIRGPLSLILSLLPCRPIEKVELTNLVTESDVNLLVRAFKQAGRGITLENPLSNRHLLDQEGSAMTSASEPSSPLRFAAPSTLMTSPIELALPVHGADILIIIFTLLAELRERLTSLSLSCVDLHLDPLSLAFNQSLPQQISETQLRLWRGITLFPRLKEMHLRLHGIEADIYFQHFPLASVKAALESIGGVGAEMGLAMSSELRVASVHNDRGTGFIFRRDGPGAEDRGGEDEGGVFERAAREAWSVRWMTSSGVEAPIIIE